LAAENPKYVVARSSEEITVNKDALRTSQHSAARLIYQRLRDERNFTLAKARDEYKDQFGIGHDDPALDQEYEKLLYNHLFWSNEPLQLPWHLALGLFLREGMGRKHGPLPKEFSTHEITVLILTRRKAAEYRHQEYKAGTALEKAANEVVSWKYEVQKGKYRPSIGFSARQIIEILQHPGRCGLKAIFDADDNRDPAEMRSRLRTDNPKR
jgi:hypothetical protein